MKSTLFVCIALSTVACDRSRKEPDGGSPKVNQSIETRKKADPPAVERSFHYPAAERVVAIGDVHGDLSATRAALRLAGAIDGSDHWAGGKLVVVQTGDQLDRGDQEREIVDLMKVLHEQARRVGGAVYSLNGNHEVMNVQGDFRYVTPGGLTQFNSITDKSPLAARAPLAMRGRAEAFLPGGQYARILSKRPVVIMVGDTVFAHGGVLSEHVAYGIGKLNAEVNAWMQGNVLTAPDLVRAENGPVWTRVYGAEGTERACRAANKTLDELGAKRMVVGHTVQKSGMSSICDGAVWRIDVGLAAYYGDNPVQVLEITEGKVQPLSAER